MADSDLGIPLPGAPDPWVGSSMPDLRDGPPYAMTEMIAAEPDLAARLVRRLQDDPSLPRMVDAIRAAASRGAPILTTGCGTSEHAAMVAAALLTDALGGPTVWSIQALELARRPPADGVVLAISHEGGTWATNEALRAAHDAGAQTGLITVSDRSPGALLADLVLTTGEQDQSWCHTVGYLSPVVTTAVIAAELRSAPLDPVAIHALLEIADAVGAAESIARLLGDCRRLLVVGSGIDYVSARELALKIEEGARLPASALQLETIRHGHLAAADDQTGLILVLTDAEGWGETIVERARAVLRSADALGMPAAALVAADLGDDLPIALTPAGRLVVPLAARLARIASAAIGSTIPLQQLAERLARARGTNPDTIGREDARHAAAADA